MEEIKEEGSHQEHLIKTESQVLPSKRLASLDVFRGFTVAVMILVDDAGGEWPVISHAPWNGCNLADFVMPFFLFIVGVSIALSFKRVPNHMLAVKKISLRTLKLLLWGILIQGGFYHGPGELTYGVDVRMVRWFGILQRIAVAYLVVSTVEISIKTAAAAQPIDGWFSLFRLYRRHWIVGGFILVTYLSILYATPVPDWHFKRDGGNFTVSCGGVRGQLNPPCNAAGYIDRQLLGLNHMYQRPAWRLSEACTLHFPYDGPFRPDAPSWCYAPFEPEGILSSLSSVLSTIVGVHFGHVLVHQSDHLSRLRNWVVMGFGHLVFGLMLHFTGVAPLNKMLYSFSYVCVTSGSAVLVLLLIYSTVDVFGLRVPFLPLEWIGMNAMLVYVAVAEGVFSAFVKGWYWGGQRMKKNVVDWIVDRVFIRACRSRRVGILLYVLFGEIAFSSVVSGILHRFCFYWKL